MDIGRHIMAQARVAIASLDTGLGTSVVLPVLIVACFATGAFIASRVLGGPSSLDSGVQTYERRSSGGVEKETATFLLPRRTHDDTFSRGPGMPRGNISPPHHQAPPRSSSSGRGLERAPPGLARPDGGPSPGGVPSYPPSDPSPSRPADRPPGEAVDKAAAMQAPEHRFPAAFEELIPPLCPTLVLTMYEARFAIAMRALADSSTVEFPIVGRAGNPLLQGVVQQVPNGRSLELTVAHPGAFPRASIGPSPTQSPSQDRRRHLDLEIRGSSGMLYGTLKASGKSRYQVIKGSKAIMDIEGEDTVGRPFTIRTAEGDNLASASRNSNSFGGVEHLEFRVQPGVDAVLVILCVLGIVLLSPKNAA